jgi:hypothetical protein
VVIGAGAFRGLLVIAVAIAVLAWLADLGL